MRDVGIKSIGEEIEEEAPMSLRTSALIAGVNELRGEYVLD